MNGKKKAVVLLVPGFPADEKDTTCIPPLQQFCITFSLLRPDIQLQIISFQYPDKRGYYLWNRIPVYSVGGKRHKYNRFFTWARVFIQLLKIRRENNLVIINSFWMTECALVGQWFARLFKIKHVVCVSGQDALKTNKYLSVIDFSKMEIIAMSESLRSHFLDATGVKIKHIIPSGIDVSKIKQTRDRRAIDILGVGALTPLKNYSLFTEVIYELKKNFPQIKASIIGKGEQEYILQENIEKYKLENNLELLGELPHDTVFSYMQKSKILLHTSTYEGQSTVMMEALACGLTIVCLNVGRVHAEGKIWICSGKEEMINKLKELMVVPLNHQPVVLMTNDDTVKAFFKVYEI